MCALRALSSLLLACCLVQVDSEVIIDTSMALSKYPSQETHSVSEEKMMLQINRLETKELLDPMPYRRISWEYCNT